VDVSGSALTGAGSDQVADNIRLEAIPALVLLFLVRTVSISPLVVNNQQFSLGLHLFLSLGYFAYLFDLKLFLSHIYMLIFLENESPRERPEQKVRLAYRCFLGHRYLRIKAVDISDMFNCYFLYLSCCNRSDRDPSILLLPDSDPSNQHIVSITGIKTSDVRFVFLTSSLNFDIKECSMLVEIVFILLFYFWYGQWVNHRPENTRLIL
jgi:hypothetical protein